MIYNLNLFNIAGSLILLSGPQGVAYIELPSNLPSLETKQLGPAGKIAKYVCSTLPSGKINDFFFISGLLT